VSLIVIMVEAAVSGVAARVAGTVMMMVVELVVVEVAIVAQAEVQEGNTQEEIQCVVECLGKSDLAQMARDSHIIAPSHRSKPTTQCLVLFKLQTTPGTLFRSPK
jgi:hypothetical protein